MTSDDVFVIDRDALDQLIERLGTLGYRTIGPVVKDGAVTLGPISGTGDLPEGWHDTQAPGSYRLEHAGDPALFGWAVGPQSMKAEVFPARTVLWRGRVADGVLEVEEDTESELLPTALVGARPCELAATAVLDRVLGGAPRPDPVHARRRAGAFVVAADCGAPSGTCFCVSMGTGPAAESGFDLALTEIVEGGHRFVVRVGTPDGAEVLGGIPHRTAEPADLAAREAVVEGARTRMGRTLDTEDLPALLARNIDHPRWDDVASRCLACGNCTLVCPTCFCSTVTDTTDIDGDLQRTRTWASCFDLGHSYVHGGQVRASTSSRYRQWLTHKLSTWHDQFGSSGCVGCGRCITWCPVGIDLTAEAAAIRATDGAGGGS